MNLPSATVSMQVVIGLCKRKETAALNFLYSNRRLHACYTIVIVWRLCLTQKADDP